MFCSGGFQIAAKINPASGSGGDTRQKRPLEDGSGKLYIPGVHKITRPRISLRVLKMFSLVLTRVISSP